MTQRLEVLSYGEAIVDFLPDSAGKRVRDVEWFRKESGGAPANVAIGIARLGRKVGLMCKVGDDEFGHFLREHLERAGVDVEGVTFTDEARTGVAFISLDEHGDRSFMFFRAPSADMTFREEDVSVSTIQRAAIMTIGSNLLIGETLRAATHKALQAAKEAGVFIAADPNVRRHLWDDDETCRREVLTLLESADLVKVNDEELAYLGGEGIDGKGFYEEICKPRGVRYLVHTRAEGGAAFYGPEFRTTVPAPHVTVVDTTGAGDGFLAGLVSGICAQHERKGEMTAAGLREDLDEWDERIWRRVLALGCYVGSRVCTELGATRALPEAGDVPWDSLGF